MDRPELSGVSSARVSEANSNPKIKNSQTSSSRAFPKTAQTHRPMLKRAIMAFKAGYKDRMHGVAAPIGGKEIALIEKDIMRFEGMGPGWEDVYLGCIETFFRDTVKEVVLFTQKAGYSYGVFHSQIDKILLAAEKAAR